MYLLQLGGVTHVVGQDVPFVDHEAEIGRTLLFAHLHALVSRWQLIDGEQLDDGLLLLLLEGRDNLLASVLEVPACAAELPHLQDGILHPGFILYGTQVIDLQVLAVLFLQGDGVGKLVLQLTLKVDLLVAAVDEDQREFRLALRNGVRQLGRDDHRL